MNKGNFMKVINVAGFHVEFDKGGKTYKVPNDGNLHYIPDICYKEDNFQGLLRVIVPPEDIRRVIKADYSNMYIDINNDNIKEILIDKVEKKEIINNGKPINPRKIKIKKSIRDSHTSNNANKRSKKSIDATS